MRISLPILIIAAFFIGDAGKAAAQGNVNNHLISPNGWNAEDPRGWSTGGNAPQDFGSLYGGAPDGKRAAVLRSRHRLAEDEFGTLMRTISADAYRGKRARLSAMVSAEKSLSKGRVALWMRVNDATGKMTAFDDMQPGRSPPGPAGCAMTSCSTCRTRPHRSRSASCLRAAKTDAAGINGVRDR